MRRLLTHTLAMLCFGLAAASAPAQAAFFPGDPVDDASSLGGLDLARDGTGAVGYVKFDAGVSHVFVSRFENGRFQAPQRVDAGLGGAGSQPVVSAAPEGRFVVAFVNGGTVYGAVRPARGAALSAPVALSSGSDPSIDLSVNGTALASFTGPGGDVRIARLDRRTNGWSVLPQSADVGPGNAAGVGTGRSRMAISADGIGLVTWGEANHVFARKVFGSGLSNAPQDLTPPTFGSRVSTLSDLPDVDAEDDSSFAQVVFRQKFADGGTRILARRQRGTAFDPPVAIDTGDESATAPRIDLAARGVGIAAMSGVTSNQPMAATIDKKDMFVPTGRLFSPSTVFPGAVPAIGGAQDDGVIAAGIGGLGENPSIRVRPFLEGVPQPDVVLSRPELGPVVPAAGLEAAADNASGVIVAWIQGGKLVAGYQDREPAPFVGYTRRSCCVAAHARLTWQPSVDLWGPMRYQVFVDGKPAGVSATTKFTLPKRLRGIRHSWQVRGSDARGQFKTTPKRKLIVDDLSPRQSVHFSRKGRKLSVRARGHDVRRAGHKRSGIGGIVVLWGDGRRNSRGGGSLRATHRYRHKGKFKLTVTTRDVAGNTAVRKRTVRVG